MVNNKLDTTKIPKFHLWKTWYWTKILGSCEQLHRRIQSKEYEIQSTPDNSNLQGKQKKVRVIEGKIV